MFKRVSFIEDVGTSVKVGKVYKFTFEKRALVRFTAFNDAIVINNTIAAVCQLNTLNEYH